MEPVSVASATFINPRLTVSISYLPSRIESAYNEGKKEKKRKRRLDDEKVYFHTRYIRVQAPVDFSLKVETRLVFGNNPLNYSCALAFANSDTLILSLSLSLHRVSLARLFIRSFIRSFSPLRKEYEGAHNVYIRAYIRTYTHRGLEIGSAAILRRVHPRARARFYRAAPLARSSRCKTIIRCRRARNRYFINSIVIAGQSRVS